ncbi:MAG TPA: PsbP-related protein [Nitrososphaeraceae archaeon]
MSLSLILISILTVVMTISLSISNVNALSKVNNRDFSMDIPDNWAFEQDILSQPALTPREFATFLVNHTEPLNEKMKDGGAFASFKQDSSYGIKNAPFDVYVKHKIDEQDGMKVTSKENGTVDNEAAVKILGDGINTFSGIKFVQYLVWHDNKPYALAYMANVKDYEKYLPQFEQMVKTFKFTK